MVGAVGGVVVVVDGGEVVGVLAVHVIVSQSDIARLLVFLVVHCAGASFVTAFWAEWHVITG